MRYLIYGAGAVGGILGAKLHLAGIETLLIARGEHLAEMRCDGLLVRHPEGELRVAVPACRGPDEIDYRADDVVILTMKAQDTEAALEALRRRVEDVAIVSCQNGVESERIALRRFARVYGMVVFMPATHLEPGVVEAGAWPNTGVLDLGRYPEGSDALAEAVARDIQASGFVSSAAPGCYSLAMTHDRLFTLAEALDLLPTVRRLIVEMQARKQAVEAQSAALEGLIGRTAGNGHLAGEVAAARRGLERAGEELQALMNELASLGVELKGIDEGLVDFPSTRERRVVYLCWRQGEETIAFWHELETGFAGRQPL